MDYENLDAVGLADLVQRGEASPKEIVEAAVRSAEATNPQINAIVVERYEEALVEAEAASGPFRGVPWVLKDMNIAKGVPHASAIKGVKDAQYRPDVDSNFVAKMREAGFVLLGVANSSELGLLPATEPEAFGATRNPWSLGHSTGGSSGGSAAAVAARIVPVAHGSDGGGSARIPASESGTIGLKPTRGRVSTGPWLRYADDAVGNSHEGLLTRTVRDLAALLDAVQGHVTGDPYWAPLPERPYRDEVGADPGALRVGVMLDDPTGAFPVDPQLQRVTRDIADRLARLGHHVEEGHPAVLAAGPIPLSFAQCFPVIVRRELDQYADRIGRPLTEDDVEPFTWEFAAGSAELTALQYATAVDALREHARQIESWWDRDGFDLLLTPTLTRLPPRLGEFARLHAEGRVFELAGALTAMTVPYNVTGQPAISLPVATSDEGLPIGVQLAAAYGRDDLLIRVAAQLEQALPWGDRRPRFVDAEPAQR